MRPKTTEDVFRLLEAHAESGALEAAFELGLFERVDDAPRSAASLARDLDIPPRRCGYWLQMLAAIGLLEETADGYVASAIARSAILRAHESATWALLAQESRERRPRLRDLTHRLRSAGEAAVPDAEGEIPPDYVDRMRDDPERARRFTRMLADLHRSFAVVLAESIDARAVRRVLDVGGGSGVVSLALAARNPDLRAVVVDLPTVVAAGREFAAEHPAGDRVTYLAADFTRDPLPDGFDLVLECDVSVYGVPVLSRLAAALRAGGRLVLIDQLAPAPGVAPEHRVSWALARSMREPDFSDPTAAELRAQLGEAGFESVAESRISDPDPGAADRGEEWTVLEASRGPEPGGAR